ncbi:MAG: ATP-dependent RNA helicase RhlE [Chitinophagales bacterium]|jgi:ATP-dependent RNA helicase RhlE
MKFNELGLSEALLQAIDKKGYTSPSPIQEKAIPPILKGRDVLASAQTGTGKTAGFALPILHLMSQKNEQGKRKVKALILTPTRELAAQVQAEFNEYAEFLNVSSTVIFGGVKAHSQISILRKGVDILVATPGRLLDLHQQRELNLDAVDFLVLDEADRMLDMGFQRDINRIINILPKKRQTLLFSATFSKEIKTLASNLLNQPVSVEATPENTTAERVDHQVYLVDKGRKATLAIKLIREGDWSQVLVFTRTKHGANRLSQKLSKNGITSQAIHGNKSQNQRTNTLANFKAGKVRVLVATDIAARGLDIPLLPHVINYELPNVAEDYVHRIGRTGRAGASGEAISFVNIDELGYLKDIESLLKQKLPSKILEGFEPTDEPDPTKGKKNQRSGRGSGNRPQKKQWGRQSNSKRNN